MMKKLIRNAALLLLGAVIELGMLAAPLAGTVYAEEKPALHEAAKGNPNELRDNHDKDKPQGKEEQRDHDRNRDRDHDRNQDRDHDRDWHQDGGHDRDHDRDWHRDGGRDDHRRWERRDFDRRMAMYRQWLFAHQAAMVNQSPVNVVMSAADVLGLNVNADTFTLISQNASQAVVQVAHDGAVFSITLNNTNGLWTVAEMFQI